MQARVRGGESAELIAADTGWPLDKVLRYAEPLLAERAYIAEQAQVVEVRRSGGGATLLEAAYAAIGADPDAGSIVWDAWRREDGRWVVSAAYRDASGEHRARWTYDPAGRNLHPLDDEARTLMGARPIAVPDADIAEALDLVRDVAIVRDDAVGREDAAESRPRLVAVPDTVDDDAIDEDLIDDVEAIELDEVEIVETEVLDDGSVIVEDVTVTELVLDLGPSADRTDTVAIPHPATADAPAKPAARKAKGKRGRASVPTWDEILFGATKRED